MRNLLLILGLAAFFASCNNSDSAPVETMDAPGESLTAAPALTGPVADLTAKWDSTASQIGAFLKDLRMSQADYMKSVGDPAAKQEAKAKLSAADRKKATQLEADLKRLSVIYTEMNGAFNTWSQNWQLKVEELNNLKNMKPTDEPSESVKTTMASLEEELQKSTTLLTEWRAKFQEAKVKIDEKRQQYDAIFTQVNG